MTEQHIILALAIGLIIGVVLWWAIKNKKVDLPRVIQPKPADDPFAQAFHARADQLLARLQDQLRAEWKARMDEILNNSLPPVTKQG